MLAALLLLAVPATRPLADAVRSAAPGNAAAWVAWKAPLHGDGRACCIELDGGRRPLPACCRLESSRGLSLADDRRGGPRPEALVVMVRVERGAVDRIRFVTDDCPIDAESVPLVWLEDVRPGDSVAWLRQQADDGSRRHADDALGALAYHQAPEAVPALVSLARGAAASETRGQALFWLAQRGSGEARAAITRAIEEDPETEVKRQAVFALSEMPRDEGVPLLIDLARRHKNPAVREQAFFWLGESEDPRALAFFEEVLR
jgi:hypothetical protein